MVKDEITTLYTLKYANQPATQQQSKKTKTVRDEMTILLTNKYLIQSAVQSSTKQKQVRDEITHLLKKYENWT